MRKNEGERKRARPLGIEQRKGKYKGLAQSDQEEARGRGLEIAREYGKWKERKRKRISRQERVKCAF